MDRCRGCRGHWFDGDELEHAFDLTTEGVSREEAASLRRALPRADPTEDEVRYVACVRCGERMARRQLVPHSGLVVDVCRPHGVWFDGGELERFQAWVRAGGLEVLRFDGIARAEADRRLAQASRETGMLGGEDPMGAGHASEVWRAVRSLFRAL